MLPCEVLCPLLPKKRQLPPFMHFLGQSVSAELRMMWRGSLDIGFK
jgi:hypothetical protein